MSDTRPAPYPADTRAKGWRFELDHERIRQSDTWALAPADLRPWLLMLWMVAWEQTPCGSLPSNDELIAARLGMQPSAFAQARPSLLRGWWQADDGRLYHHTMTERVVEMMTRRRKESDRKALARQRTPVFDPADSDDCPAPVPPLSQGTGAGLHPESDTGTGTGTREEPSIPSGQKEARKRARPPPCPDGVSEQVWADWLLLRKAKGAPVTGTVVDGAAKEAAKAGITLDAFLRVWCVRGSQGLQADWLKPHERAAPNGSPAEPAWRTEQRERNEAFLGPAASRRRHPEPAPEAIDVTALLLD